LYLIDLDGSSRIVAEDIRLNNGLAFSPDAATLYHSDSIRRTVYQYAVEDDGTLGEKRFFAKVDTGGPDGLVVSADGRVWVALAGGGHGVSVFNPDGSASHFIEIPQPMCTSVCFGGEDLRTLFIVSGSEGMGTDKAGAVYCTRTDVPGLMVPLARVSLR
jgi:gluconolactonase